VGVAGGVVVAGTGVGEAVLGESDGTALGAMDGDGVGVDAAGDAEGGVNGGGEVLPPPLQPAIAKAAARPIAQRVRRRGERVPSNTPPTSAKQTRPASSERVARGAAPATGSVGKNVMRRTSIPATPGLVPEMVSV
jgi:hypothetical protein